VISEQAAISVDEQVIVASLVEISPR